MAVINLGRVAPFPRGQHSALTEYNYFDLVTDSGSSYLYINKIPSTGSPLSSTSHWQQIAEKGDTGPSAYDAAVAGEYAGTEAEFNAANAGIEAAKDAALGAAETANEAAENAETAAYRSMLWRKTASGNPVSVYPVPESSLYARVSGAFTQEGTGDPSPENIRPITPWLASGGQVKVNRTGKNLFDKNNAATILNAYYGSAIPIKSGAPYRIVFIPCFANTTYTVRKTTGSVFNIGYTDTLPAVGVTVLGSIALGTAGSSSITTGVTAQYLVAYVFNGNSAVITEQQMLDSVQIELGSTATPYEPYTEQEITLTAPQEIAAGWMDNEGAGQVTWAKKVFDGTEPDIGAASLLPNYTTIRVYWSGYNTIGAIAPITCSHIPSGSNSGSWRTKFQINSSSTAPRCYMYIPVGVLGWDGVMSDEEYIAIFKAYLAAQYAAGTPVTIYYQLATPIPLTPTIAPLTALPQLDRITPRQNVLTASTGQIELTYAKSPIRESDEIATAIAAL